MFVARRLHSFSKIKSPYKEGNNNANGGAGGRSAASDHTMNNNNGSQQQHQQQHQWKGMSEEEMKREQSYKNHNYQQEQQEKVRQQYDAWATKKKIPIADNGVDGYMRSHLVILQMDQSKKPTLKEVKEAYRKYALIHHPDRLPVGDVKRKHNEEKFAEASSSYKTLKELLGKE